jgi:hypothetical protein
MAPRAAARSPAACATRTSAARAAAAAPSYSARARATAASSSGSACWRARTAASARLRPGELGDGALAGLGRLRGARHGRLGAQPVALGPGEPVGLGARGAVALGVVAGGEVGELAAHVGHLRLLLRGRAVDDGQLLHRRLALGVAALELRDLDAERAPPLGERRHGLGLALELLQAVAEVLPAGLERVGLLLERVEHGAEVGAERPRAGRARALGAELLDAVALGLRVGELRPQRLELGLGLLPVAHVGGALRLEVGLHDVELRPPLGERGLRLLLELRRRAELRLALASCATASARARSRSASACRRPWAANSRSSWASSSRSAGSGASSSARRAASARAAVAASSSRPRRAASRPSVSTSAPATRASPSSAAARSRASAAARQRGCASASAASARARSRAASFSSARAAASRRSASASCCAPIRVGHPGAQPLRLGGHELAPVAHQGLRRAEALVAEHPREELRPLRRPHGRHHVELLLPR